MVDLAASVCRPLEAFGGAEPGLAAAPPMGRFVLRGRRAALEAAETVLGLVLPREACRSASAGGRHALWLGPDEWLLITPPDEASALNATLEAAMSGLPHALVEVSQRQTALRVEGPLAAERLSAGCPLDLDLAAFPVGACSRTLMAKAEIVLWRTAPDSFHIEVWRSFSAYVWRYLDMAGLDLLSL
jgi:sarcosine oxidase subunit gamma